MCPAIALVKARSTFPTFRLSLLPVDAFLFGLLDMHDFIAFYIDITIQSWNVEINCDLCGLSMTSLPYY
jgi:hypothetical protein